MLSDERTETRWAYPERRALAYSRPSGSARKVGRLRLLTEDKFPELYLALSRWTDPQGNQWVRIRLPKRPNGVKGWVRADALGALTVNHRLIDVDKRTLRLRVFDHGKVVMTARVGVGKKGTITPSGRFYVREKFHVKGVPLYGPRAIGTSAYAPTLSDWPGGGVVGLHGTNQPGLIPGRLARLHPPEEPRHHAALPARRARHADQYPQLAPASRVPGRFRPRGLDNRSTPIRCRSTLSASCRGCYIRRAVEEPVWVAGHLGGVRKRSATGVSRAAGTP